MNNNSFIVGIIVINFKDISKVEYLFNKENSLKIKKYIIFLIFSTLKYLFIILKNKKDIKSRERMIKEFK